MAEQKAQKSFELRDSRDMLEKLQWELSNLFCRQPYDIRACQFHAINCAITAWHVTDWLWHDISSELKDGRRWKKCQDLQDYVRKECPELNLCHQIATGSKHCLMTYKPDPTISAGISGGKGYDYRNPIIVEGDKQYQAIDVFQTAQIWFEAFLRDENIFPEEPFISMGDP
jgi:hypothetical protein